MYLIGTRIEAVRQVNSAQAQAVLYSDHPPASGEDASPARGSTAVTLSGGELADPRDWLPGWPMAWPWRG